MKGLTLPFFCTDNSLLHCATNIRNLAPSREQRTHHEHATKLSETVCSRCAARLVQYRTPVNLIVNIINGSHRQERAVAFTSYCKPEKHLNTKC